tara:strand:+ start:200 stop:1291 length:1092 start_codon:yes stop_codon:yes gene_type:complete
MKNLIKINKISFLLSFFIFFSCAQPQSTLPVYNEKLSLEEQKLQSKLFAESWLDAYIDLSEIGYRILFGASDLCLIEDQIYDIGIDVATRYSGPENIREEIEIILDLDENLKVVAVGQNTPASEAGLRRGDKIINIDNETAPVGENATEEFYKLMKLDYAKSYDFVIQRGNQEIPMNVKTSRRCRFNHSVNLDNNTFNAFADGENMYFTLRITKWLLQEDLGVAIVYAHELGHNANRHINDKKTNAAVGMSFGLLAGILLGGNVGQTQDLMNMGSQIGANQYSVAYENEADYLSLYALALSGYDIEKTINFWRRFAIEVPNSIYSSTTHPSTSERFVRMEATIKEIQQKINSGVVLLPTYNDE